MHVHKIIKLSIKTFFALYVILNQLLARRNFDANATTAISLIFKNIEAYFPFTQSILNPFRGGQGENACAPLFHQITVGKQQ